MVRITSTKTKEEIVLTESDFASAASILADEKFKLQMAFENGDNYEVPMAHDPTTLMYDNNCFHLASAVCFQEHLLYNLGTEDEDMEPALKRTVAPYDAVGYLRMKWTILPSEDYELSEDPDAPEPEVEDVEDPSDLIGKSWTALLEIEKAVDLPVTIDQAYVQYDFFGADGTETFTSENVSDITHSPVWKYRRVHHVPVVTQDFIDFIQQPFLVHVYVSPYFKTNNAAISTSNPKVATAFGAAAPGDAAAVPADALQRIKELEAENAVLKAEVQKLTQELAAARGESAVHKRIDEARTT